MSDENMRQEAEERRGEEERRVIEGGGGFDRNIYKERKGCVW